MGPEPLPKPSPPWICFWVDYLNHRQEIYLVSSIQQQRHLEMFFPYAPTAMYLNPPSPHVTHKPSAAEAVATKIHQKLLEDARSQRYHRGQVNGSQSPKEYCYKILEMTFSRPRPRTDDESVPNFARALVSCTSEEEELLIAFFDQLSADTKKSSDSKWTRSGSFLLLLAWCLNYSIPNSPLETFLTDLLIKKTCSLSSEEKKILHLPLQESLKKLPVSPDGETGMLATERDAKLALLHFRTIFVDEGVAVSHKLPPNPPPLAEDPFPLLDEEFCLDVSLWKWCMGECGEKEEGEEKRWKEEGCNEADCSIQKLVSRSLHLLSFRKILQEGEEVAECFRRHRNDTQIRSKYHSLCQACAEGVTEERILAYLPSCLSLLEDQANKAEKIVSSHSLPHILFLFRKPASPSPPLPPSTPPLPYVLPFSLLHHLLSTLFNSFLYTAPFQPVTRLHHLFFRFAAVALRGMKLVGRSGGEVGGEEEKRMTLERGGLAASLLLEKASSFHFHSFHLFRHSFFLPLSHSLSLTHSLPLLSTLPPSLSKAIQQSEEKDPEYHFDPTHPLLLPAKAREEILSLLLTCFKPSSSAPFAFLSSLLKGGVVVRVGCVVDGRGELSDGLRCAMAKLFRAVAFSAEKSRDRLHAPSSEEEMEEETEEEDASEEERREFVSLSQDALEEEGAEDSLLLLAGVEMGWRDGFRLCNAASFSLDGLAWLDIVVG